MSTHPQIPRGSDADVAEGGLDVEASFTEVDAQTSRRMSMEAASQRDLPRGPNGPNAMDMLTSPVEGGMQDEPNLSADRWDASQGLKTEDALETSPNQEGPPGTARDGGGRG